MSDLSHGVYKTSGLCITGIGIYVEPIQILFKSMNTVLHSFVAVENRT